jgi:P27 family predicted phage terminase small subunit
MAGKPQKPTVMLTDRRPQRHRGMVLPFRRPEGPPPAMPPGRFLKQSRDVWARFWTAPISQTVDRESDVGQVERWITYIDEWLRAMRGFRKERIVEGSTGQPVLNPLGAYALKLERLLAKVEEKFGLTPLDRMRLGITFGEAHRSLRDINAELDEDEDEMFEIPEGFQPKRGKK